MTLRKGLPNLGFAMNEKLRTLIPAVGFNVVLGLGSLGLTPGCGGDIEETQVVVEVDCPEDTEAKVVETNAVNHRGIGSISISCLDKEASRRAPIEVWSHPGERTTPRTNAKGTHRVAIRYEYEDKIDVPEVIARVDVQPLTGLVQLSDIQEIKSATVSE